MRLRERLLLLILLLIATSLAYALYVEIDGQTQTPIAESSSPTQLQTNKTGIEPLVELPVAPPLADFDEMVARPLFSPTRRPPSDAAEPLPMTTSKASPRIDKSHFLVMGILITDSSKTALLKLRDKGAETVRAREGATVAGSNWKVTEITPTWVKIEQGSKSETLKLSDNVLSAAAKRKLQLQAKKENAKQRQRAAPKRTNALQRNRKAAENRRKRVATPRRTTPRSATRSAVRSQDH